MTKTGGRHTPGAHLGATGWSRGRHSLTRSTELLTISVHRFHERDCLFKLAGRIVRLHFVTGWILGYDFTVTSVTLTFVQCGRHGMFTVATHALF